jgi:hypothetical protein
MQRLIRYGVPLFCFFLPWQTRLIINRNVIEGQFFEFGIVSLYAVQAILLFIVAASGWRKINDAYQRVVLLTALLVIPVLLSLFWSQHQELALNALLHISMAMLFFLLLLDERVDVRLVMLSFCAGLIVPVAIGFSQVAIGSSAASTLLGMSAHEASRLGEAVTNFFGERTLRAHGGFAHPNVLGGYLAVGLATLFGLWQYAKKDWHKYGLILTGAFFAGGLFLTFSQSAWLGLMLALIVSSMIIFLKKTSITKMLVIPVAFLVIGAAFGHVFIEGSQGFVDSHIELEQRSLSDRVEEYHQFFAFMSPRDYFIGNGAGNYLFALADEYPYQGWWQYRPIHNVIFLVVGEVGLFGLICVLLWSSLIDKINFARFPNQKAVSAFAMGNVILVILFFDHYLWSQWAGLALVAYVMAMTVRLGEDD